jgi:hypothetical protein
MWTAENFAGCPVPITSEDTAQLVHDRAFELEMQILDWIAGVLSWVMPRTDIHTAGEADPTIHDQDFAVEA